MSDKLADGRSFRILTVVDQFTRECVCLEVDRAILHRPPRSNETQLYVVRHHPSFQSATAELGSVVHGNAGRQTSALCFGSLQRLGYLHARHCTLMQKTHNLKENSFRVFLLSKVQFAPLLEREHFRGFPGHCVSCRICGGAHKHRTVVTAHANVASY